MDLKTFSKVRNYDANDHLFIFLSLIYAFVITYSIDNIVEFCNSLSLRSLNDLQRILNNTIALLWNMLALFLSIESWWTVWSDKEFISKRFKNFLFLICYPILLSIVTGLIRRLILKSGQYSIPYGQYVIFFMVASILFFYLSFLRKRFDRYDKDIRLRLFFAFSFFMVSLFCLFATFLESENSAFWLFLILISSAFLYLGYRHLWSFIVKNRDDHFRISQYAEAVFFEKIQFIAALPYRHFFSFGFIVVELKNCENKYKPKVYNRAYELILSKTRRYYICANVVKRIVIFIPYIDAICFEKNTKNDLQRIDNLLRTDDTLKEYEFSIKSVYGTFEKEEIEAIGPGAEKHLHKLESILEAKYKEATSDIFDRKTKSSCC